MGQQRAIASVAEAVCGTLQVGGGGFDLEAARTKILPAQAPLLDRLEGLPGEA